MKSTRRMLALVLCLVMCLALLPASASAANILASGWANTAQTAEFNLYTDGRLVVSGTGSVGPMTTWSFTSGFDGGYQSQNDAVMATRAAVTSLEVTQGIQQIGQDAFRECPNLAYVDLPVSLSEDFGPAIGQSAFQDCSSLYYIYIPSSVRTIGVSAFQGCSNLTEVYLSDGIRRIMAQAFYDCVSLQSVTIPANVNWIGGLAFGNCNSLKTITFTGNYTAGMLQVPPNGTFTNVEATVYYPVDNSSWNALLDPMNASVMNTNFGGRLTWKTSAAEYTGNDGWVQKGNDINGRPIWHYYMGGKMVRENWVAYEGRWFYFGKDGRMLMGRQAIGDKYYYFGQGAGIDNLDLGARYSGWIQDPDDGNNYYYDEDGVWQPSYSGVNDTGLNMFQKGWQRSNDGKWFYIKNQHKVTGWMKWKKNWYYLDPTTGAMVTGWLTWNDKTYYLRPADIANRDGFPEGSMVAGRSEIIGGTAYTFDKDGVLKGGKMDDNPLNLATGFRQVGGKWYFYRSDGTMAKSGWELVNSRWYYFNKNGVMQRGWVKWKDNWYFLTKWEGGVEVTDPTTSNAGVMVTGIQTIPVTKDGLNVQKTYFFKSNGALNGKGWVKQNKKWYYLRDDGTIVTGWFRDGSKWYFLDPTSNPIGEMVTGNVTTLADGVTLITDPDGNPGTQAFKANGEWMGAGAKAEAGTAGSWGKDSNGKWHYYDTNGNPVTGWQKISDKWYYLDPGSTPPGVMLTGFQTIDGQRYFFDSSGIMQAGWQHLDGVWYYFNPEHKGSYGAMMTGWQKINGEWYYMDPGTGACQTGWIENPAGSGKWYYMNRSGEGTYGAMHHGGWFQRDGKWYYLNPEHDGEYGKQLQGWRKISGKWYYMREDANPAEGWMVTGRQQLTWNGVTNYYYFADDGHMETNYTDSNGHHYGADGTQDN